MTIAAQIKAPSRPKKRLEHRLAKPAELALYGLLATGLALFGPLGLPWPVVRWSLVAHAMLAVVLAPTVLAPFWWLHRRLLARSRRPFQVWSGRVLEAALAATVAAGLWLLCIGANGTSAGVLAYWLHLGISVPLVMLVAVHAWRFSALRLALGGVSALGLLMATATPCAGAPTTPAAESRSLLLEAGGAALLSANFDAGSVSRIDRASGKQLAETVLGGDIRAVAVDADDGIVAATDFAGDKVWLLSAASLGVRTSVAVAGRPAGVVYDARNRLFWVAAIEGDKLYGLSPAGAVKAVADVAESPRGLALLPDGRLLVSHAFIGAVSIYDTTHLPLQRAKLITLAVSHNADATVSQGLPRVLDRIAVSPDGKQAWLPHELWSFDHPFQFQSTVFPAISVLVLTPGAEHEAVSQRKELFKQIAIVEDGSRTRIVSNPADVAFSADGARAYATMAGSEDLVTFDLARALPIDSTSPKAKSTDGAKATDIFRHLPGANPRGLVVDGADIFVQNAMGFDLSRLTTGGEGNFARVGVVATKFATLAVHDPLPPQLRRGERLFHLANSSVDPDAPMTGDNWMSCSSCHVDGFNFSNRALFAATKPDKARSAVTGHATLQKMVAGEFVGDYIRMVRDTQGGMGADTRFPTPQTDPAAPSEAVKAKMRDLHAYVTSSGNLPLLATWLRGQAGGAKVDAADWTSSAACAACHADIYKQWANSRHHYSGQSDPYYVVLEDLAAKVEGEPFRAWCMGCHQPQALLAGQTKTAGLAHLLDKDGAALMAELTIAAQAVDEGAGCLVCHRVGKIEDAGGMAGGNASFDIALHDRPLYPGETSDSAVLRFLADRLIRAKPEVHAASLGENIKGNAKLCAACHEEFSPGTGSYIVETYQEWAASPYNAPGDPAKNRTCADCHMHADPARIGEAIPAQATDGGPLKPNVFTHGFPGGQYQLAALHDPAAGDQSVALLKRAARLSVAAWPGGFVVRVANVGAGHALPTGVSDFRELWLDVTAKDASGAVVLSSGKLDDRSEVEPKARMFRKVFNDKDAHAVGLAFWRYARLAEDTRIPAGGSRDEAFELPAGTRYPVTVDVRLEFRTFPQWVTDLARQRFPDLPNPAILDIADAAATLPPPPVLP